MANNNYLRSRKREQGLVREYRKEGYWACRSAGSKSPWDVWAFHPEKRLFVLIQVKTKRGSSKSVYKKESTYLNICGKSWTEQWI